MKNGVPCREYCLVRKEDHYILCLFHDVLPLPECLIAAKLLINRHFSLLLLVWRLGGGAAFETQYVGVAAQDQYKL